MYLKWVDFLCHVNYTSIKLLKKKISQKTEHAKAQVLKWLTNKTSVSSTSSLNVLFIC